MVALRRRSLWFVLACLFSAGEVQAEVQIAATITPVHSLVSMVTDGVSEPALIIRPGASPHHYALKPSEARALRQADLVFWVGESLEPWMAKSLRTLASEAKVVELGAIDGLTKLSARAGGVWEDHDDHEHDEANENRDADAHDAALIDPHLWLDPLNALTWLEAMATELSAIDPENAKTYQENATAAKDKLKGIIAKIRNDLEPVRDKPYIVFHDAYQYFERRFGLSPVGAISLSDADRPSAARLTKLRQRIEESGAECAFTEPQFEPKLLDTVIEGSKVKKGTLDPMGADFEPGQGLYPTLLERLAFSLVDCFS